MLRSGAFSSGLFLPVSGSLKQYQYHPPSIEAKCCQIGELFCSNVLFIVCKNTISTKVCTFTPLLDVENIGEFRDEI